MKTLTFTATPVTANSDDHLNPYVTGTSLEGLYSAFPLPPPLNVTMTNVSDSTQT
jgi:hypothetical protein